MPNPIGVILVSTNAIVVRRLETNGFTETRYPESTASNLNDAARVLGCWLEIAEPPLPPVFHDALTDRLTNAIDDAIRHSKCSSYNDWQALVHDVLTKP